MKFTQCVGIVFVLCLARPTLAADKPFPESMVTLLAQPAVFFVRATADIELTVPESVSVDLEALKQELKTAQDGDAGRLTLADRYWDLICENPDKYLSASERQKTWVLSDVDAWSGTAFAVSREGILLTNAHIVCTGPERPIGRDDLELLNQPIQKDAGEMAKILGRATLTEKRANKVLVALYAYYAARSRVVTRFKAARVVLDYRVDHQKSLATLKEGGVEQLFRSMKREEISVPATVLAVGEWLPGKDVAVIQVTFEPEEQARLILRSKQQTLPGLETMLADLQNDRIVCLPLGNSEDVLPQARVQSLGFPGVGYSEEFMDPESQFKASSKSGQIGQTKRMNGGWNIFEMNAATNHGDSGGPVLDISGKVIALNVGKAKVNEETSVLRLAIPINIAHQMLNKLGIKPDPGPVSAHWERGLRLYANGSYDESLQQIQTAIRIQKGSSVLGNREANWYLRDMAGRCLQKLGKIPGGN